MGKEIKYITQYESLVRDKDVPRLDTYWQREISTAIKQKLTTKPDLYGTPLRQSLKGFRKLRVGDYRVVYTIKKKIVRIVIIGHRSEVYQEIVKRLRL